MPPTRRMLRALGSLQLVGYANIPTKVITELAFITDKRVNGLTEDVDDSDTPLEVQFSEFMDGVNSRGKGTNTRQRKMTMEQVAAVLLVAVQKGHVELLTRSDDSQTIDVIKILPGAKRTLASFLPKLRAYGDIPYDQQYRGAIALAKRHFFPKGKAPTKRELMALLLQSYQEKRELRLRYQAQANGVQTSASGISTGKISSSVQTTALAGVVELPGTTQNNPVVADPLVAPVSNSDLDDDDNHDVFSEPASGSVQLTVSTPVAPRSFNPYMTPVSNPRHADHIHIATVVPSPLDGSLTPTIDGLNGATINAEDESTDEFIGEMLQVTGTTRGRLNYYYNKFVTACQRITLLEGQKEQIERKFDLTQRRLDETEQRLHEANADRGKLRRWVDSLLCQVDSVCSGLGVLREMASHNVVENEG